MANKKRKSEKRSENRIQVGLIPKLRKYVEQKAKDPLRPRSYGQVISDFVLAAYEAEQAQQERPA